MPRPKRWQMFTLGHGGTLVRLSHWKYYLDWLNVMIEPLDVTDTVWRGQAFASWHLESGLQRLARRRGVVLDGELTARHLEHFKLAVRGRRGANPQVIDNEADWWSLGQHYGLATPLLDWTTSPFVALYFAFLKEGPVEGGQRAVWGLNRRNISALSTHVGITEPLAPRPIFVDPRLEENARLVNQGGLFTLAPPNQTLIEWIEAHVAQQQRVGTYLKIVIPDVDRERCLKVLRRMNITHLSLFPDVYGAAKHCNAVF